MKTKPGCCNLWASEITKDKPAPEDIVLYARLGIHKYNMIQGTNLQLHGIEKYTVYRKVPYSIHYVTAVAKDPAAGGSLVTFQSKFYEEGFHVKRLTCSIARPKPGPHDDQAYSPLTKSEPEDKSALPEWPGDNAFDDKKHYYVLDLSKLVISKVAVYSSDENIVVPNERLNARNAHGFKATRDRVAIIRRKMDKFSGDITLSFEGLCEWRRTFL
ncbi:hypothetical protein Bca52824_055837 [Brassica carinata]|uniref:Uncharacterized protein n=1 Tax=Brassica carinata TaxID=52824 RepID=A0A8X7RAS1_BRACI|nr:hypothetical protein Bca52824_055837 [Brassica carinata]